MERYEEYIKLLKEICKERSFPLNYKKLPNGFRFYYITIAPKKIQKTILFSAGIHGNEIAGPYAVLKFLSTFKQSKHRLIILPIVNPYGFNRDIRYNAEKQDINRRFCSKLDGEAKTAYSVIKKFNPDLFVSLHEWSGRNGYYMYASDISKEKEISLIPKFASENEFKIFDHIRINSECVKNGIIWHPENGYLAKDERNSCTLENQMYKDGIHYLCTETPSRAKLSKRVDTQTKIISYIVEDYYGTNK